MEQRDAGIDAAFTSTVNKAIEARGGIDEVGARSRRSSADHAARAES